MNDRAPATEPDVAPAFEASDDERLESLATTGRGPLRLVAAAVLAADSRRAARLARRSARPATSLTGARDDAGPTTSPAPAPASRKPAPAPTPARAARDLTPARLQKARSSHQRRLLNGPRDPVQKVADERAWERWQSVQPDEDEQNGLGRLDEPHRRGLTRWRGTVEATKPLPPAPARRPRRAPAPPPGPATKGSLRQRASAALDRLAEQEVARGARLEERVIPQFGRSGRR